VSHNAQNRITVFALFAKANSKRKKYMHTLFVITLDRQIVDLGRQLLVRTRELCEGM
jgi:hypothetical protein